MQPTLIQLCFSLPVFTDSGSNGASPSADSNAEDRPKFQLHRFNPRRAIRGKEAAEVKVTWSDGDVEYLWMSRQDIKSNMRERGTCDGLLECLDAYRKNVEVLAGGLES